MKKRSVNYYRAFGVKHEAPRGSEGMKNDLGCDEASESLVKRVDPNCVI